MIDKVDSLIVRDNASGNSARFEVLPGDHEVGISLMRTIPGFLTTKVQHSGYIVLRLHARRRTHLPKPRRHRRATLDADRHRRDRAQTDRWFLRHGVRARRCRAPSARASDDTAAESAPAPPPASTADGGATSPVVAAAADAGAAEPPVEPPGPRVVAADPDEPQHQPVALAAQAGGNASDAEVSGRRPGSGLSIFTPWPSAATTSSRASTTSGNSCTLSAGQAFILGIGAMVTPLWPSDVIGFGVGVDGALKYDNIDASNGTASRASRVFASRSRRTCSRARRQPLLHAQGRRRQRLRAGTTARRAST